MRNLHQQRARGRKYTTTLGYWDFGFHSPAPLLAKLQETNKNIIICANLDSGPTVNPVFPTGTEASSIYSGQI